MFKKPCKNESDHIKSRKKTKEELLREIEKLHRIINGLEKLQNAPQNVKEESEEYSNPPQESVKTCTLKPTKIKEQSLLEIVGFQKVELSLLEVKGYHEKIGSIIPDAFIIADDQGRIIFWNKAAEKIFGYSSEEVLNNDLPSILIPSKYHKVFKEGFSRFKKTGEGSIVAKISEFNAKKKNGTEFPIEISLSSIKVNKKWYSVAIIRDVSERKEMEKKLIQSHQRLEEMLDNAVYTLVKMVELRDPYISGHQKRVSMLALAIAREMGFSKREIERIKVAAMVHDIGKISIPTEILSKPDKLAEIEFSLIKTHSRTGHDILMNINFPWTVEEIVLQHHERIDGSGYPQGLNDDEILIEAKIIAVADVVEAMSSHRPYRPALGIKKALEEISQNRGILYDPKVADTCLMLFREKNFEF